MAATFSSPLCLTIGNFDGVHLGHKFLLQYGKRIARDHNLDFALMTFWPHPRTVLHGAGAHQPLTTRTDKLTLLATAGADRIMEARFTPELAQLQPREFISQYLVPINVRHLVIGHDFRLGHDRGGSPDILLKLGAEFGMGISQAPPFTLTGQPVSSSLLREAIAKGQLELAAQMLGRPYSVNGQVGHGFQRGAQLGFPTANLEDIHTLLPPHGVYASCLVDGDRRYAAVTNIGANPTFGNARVTVEAHALGASPNLYGHNIKLEFISFLRPEVKFSSPETLRAQIGQDVKAARAILDSHAG